MLEDVILWFGFMGFVCGLFLLGSLVGWLFEKYEEYKQDKERKECSFSCHVMTDEEVAEWFKSLRK